MMDKQLIIELVNGNCRLSYARLARHFGVSVNAIKKRVKNHLESGVLARFHIQLNGGLIGGGLRNRIFGEIWTDGSEEKEAFIQQLDALPYVYSVSMTTRSTYGVYCRVAGASEILDLTQSILGYDAVTEVDLDLVVYLDSPGQTPQLSKSRRCEAFDFTRSDLLVLRCLFENPRMQIKDIASRTGLTSKQVRRIIKTFEETSCVVFHGWANLHKGGLVNASIKTQLDTAAISNQEFAYWLYEQYPFECWLAATVADKPDIVIQIIEAESIQKIEEIASRIKSSKFAKEVDTLVTYGDSFHRIFRYQSERHIEDMLKAAGL